MFYGTVFYCISVVVFINSIYTTMGIMGHDAVLDKVITGLLQFYCITIFFKIAMSYGVVVCC